MLLAGALAVALGSSGCGSDSDSGKGGGGGSGGSTGTGGDCTSKMYGKYGASAFKTVTSDLVATAASDAKVGKFFSGLDTDAKVKAFIDSLDKFLVSVYGGPNDYTGPNMAAAHKGLNITSDDYDYFVGLIVATLEKDGVTKADVTECFAGPVTDAKFKASVVGK